MMKSIVCFVFMLMGMAWQSAETTATGMPIFIVILADDLGYGDVGCGVYPDIVYSERFFVDGVEQTVPTINGVSAVDNPTQSVQITT